MSILRNKVASSFSQIPNSIFTSDLSHGAVRVYCYLCAKPDGWKVINADIMSNCKIGDKSTIAKYFKELLDDGWIVRERRVRAGKFIGGYDYELREIPNMEKSRIRENAEYGKTQKHSNTKTTSNTEKDNTLNFDEFWSKWPKRIDKKKAEQKWKRLTLKEQEAAIAGIEKFVEGKEKQFICGPVVYLGNARWEDEVESASEYDPYAL